MRTQHDPGTGPQYNDLPPHVAYDPVFSDSLMLRRRQVLDVLENLQDPVYVERVLEMIEVLDFERGFHTLQNCMAYLKELGEWEDVYEAFHKKHGSLAGGIESTLEECLRRDHIKRMRATVADPEHRFFLALLLNVPTRANLLTLVSQRFSEVSPFDTIIRWASELMEETECGFAILDAAFPQELEIGFDDQPSFFLAALRKFLDADFKLPKAFPQDALQPIGTALSESSLGLLVN